MREPTPPLAEPTPPPWQNLRQRLEFICRSEGGQLRSACILPLLPRQLLNSLSPVKGEAGEPRKAPTKIGHVWRALARERSVIVKA